MRLDTPLRPLVTVLFADLDTIAPSRQREGLTQLVLNAIHIDIGTLQLRRQVDRLLLGREVEQRKHLVALHLAREGQHLLDKLKEVTEESLGDNERKWDLTKCRNRLSAIIKNLMRY